MRSTGVEHAGEDSGVRSHCHWKHIATVCSRDSDVWTSLKSNRSSVYPAGATPAFVFHLCMRVARLYLGKLNWIRIQADTVEQEIHKSMRNDMLIRLLELEKCLVDITSSLRSHDPLWDRLRRGWQRELTEQEQKSLEDVRIEFKQARDLAEIHSGILSGMMDAFASIISNNLNVVIADQHHNHSHAPDAGRQRLRTNVKLPFHAMVAVRTGWWRAILSTGPPDGALG